MENQKSKKCWKHRIIMVIPFPLLSSSFDRGHKCVQNFYVILHSYFSKVRCIVYSNAKTSALVLKKFIFSFKLEFFVPFFSRWKRFHSWLFIFLELIMKFSGKFFHSTYTPLVATENLASKYVSNRLRYMYIRSPFVWSYSGILNQISVFKVLIKYIKGFWI